MRGIRALFVFMFLLMAFMLTTLGSMQCSDWPVQPKLPMGAKLVDQLGNSWVMFEFEGKRILMCTVPHGTAMTVIGDAEKAEE